MALLIDGYNLLHGTDLFGRGPRAGTLEGSREALTAFVMAAVECLNLGPATMVFDSKDAPPGLPDTYHFKGLLVRFARGYHDADELLEELIAAHHSPARLTVVSSDHRVQWAAKRRRARYVDSRPWYEEARRQMSQSGDRLPDAKPEGPFSTEEVAAYVREFQALLDEEGALDLELPPARSTSSETPHPPSSDPPGFPADEPLPASPGPKGRGHRAQPDPFADDKNVDLGNPFPPGYGEDLLE